MAIQRVSPATVGATPYYLNTQSDNQIRQVDRNLALIYPNETPFLAFSNQHVQMAATMHAKRYEWGEQPDPPRAVTVVGTTAANGATVGAAATALFISPTNAVVAHDTLMDERSGEVLFIISNTSGALVVGTRGAYQDDNPTLLTFPEGTQLVIGPSSKEEFASHSDPKFIQPNLLYNCPQTLEQDLGVSTLAQAIDYYLLRGGTQRDNQEFFALRAFKRQMERLSLFGRRMEGNTLGPNSLFLGFAGGIEYFINAVGNVHDVNGAFTYAYFADAMSDHARVGAGDRKEYIGFGCGKIGNIMRRWAGDFASEKGFYQDGESKVFGLSYSSFAGSNWRLHFVQHEMFEESDTRSSQLMVLKAGNNKRTYVNKLDEKTHKGITSPERDGTHGYIDQITATMTLKVDIPEANCMFKGITS